jgi:hypothetical protein
LKAIWWAETAHLSSTTEICMHFAYQQIIGMGWPAVPFIIDELRKSPNLWFWALRAITGANPVPPAERGIVAAMATRWLAWAENNLGLPACKATCSGYSPDYRQTTTRSRAISRQATTALHGPPEMIPAGGGRIRIPIGRMKPIVRKL